MKSSVNLVSQASAARALARAERDPGPSARIAKRNMICRLRSVVSPLGPRKSGLPDLPRLTADLGQARDRCLAALRPGHERSAARKANRWPQPHSRCQTAQCSSFPRRIVAPGLVSIHSHPTQRGAGGAPTDALSLLSRVRGATGPHPAGRGAPHDAGRSPLGAPPWRFSAGGRASISGIASGSVQRAPRSQVVMPGGRCPGPPEPAVTSRGRRTPLPAPPFRTVSGRRPSMSEDGRMYSIFVT